MPSIRFVSSGLARFVAGRRVGVTALRTAPLIRNNVFRAPKTTFGTRLMATAAGNHLEGRIYQVIGAVVDVVCVEKIFFRVPASYSWWNI